MARIAPIKTAAQATANYGSNAGASTAVQLWSTNLTADLPAIYNAAIAAAPLWTENVSTVAAQTAFKAGLTRASNNTAPTIKKIQTTGVTAFKNGVAAAAAVGGNYAAFAAEFQPAVSNEITTLNRTNARGDYDANIARLTAYLTWLHGQKGNFKQ